LEDPSNAAVLAALGLRGGMDASLGGPLRRATSRRRRRMRRRFESGGFDDHLATNTIHCTIAPR
jgi:hypothetical protein